MPESPQSAAPDESGPKPGALLGAAVRGHCPQCQSPTLFAGPIRFASACRACGLDLTQFNVGDGPAAFLTLIVGAVMVGLALTLELKVHPPLWLHILIWTPLTILAVIGCLRVAKAALLILEYRNKASEGRIAPLSDSR